MSNASALPNLLADYPRILARWATNDWVIDMMGGRLRAFDLALLLIRQPCVTPDTVAPFATIANDRIHNVQSNHPVIVPIVFGLLATNNVAELEMIDGLYGLVAEGMVQDFRLNRRVDDTAIQVEFYLPDVTGQMVFLPAPAREASRTSSNAPTG